MIKQLFISYLCAILLSACQPGKTTSSQPNILWITIEDLTPMLGCYGDPVALSPNIDRLSKEGVRYTNAFATAAVCSPARSCLLTGVYASTLGTQHLRSETKVPDVIQTYPQYLRKAGYYCTNNSKEDYNFEPVGVWDESSKEAHWRNRETDQPFFAVFNFETTHQSRIFGSDSLYQKRFESYLPFIRPTDPASIPLPPYFLDSPDIRRLWARYYDNVQIVDLQVKELLDQLEEDGLRENTIIFFYSDHGTGMPRGKRALYDSGLKVPLIIVAPKQYQEQYQLVPGIVDDRLVSFVDFAPTLLNMLDITIPDFMQGQAFLGPNSDSENELVFATSDRVDEAYELVRSVRNKEYRYIRNFLPHLPLIQPNYYSDKSEIMKEVYRVLAATEQLTEAQQSMWYPKRSVEELYHIPTDPFETNNLANDPAYRDILEELRMKQKEIMLKTFDSALAPEAYMYAIAKESAPYEVLRDTTLYPLERTLNLLDQLYQTKPTEEEIINRLRDEQPLVSYWTMIWLQSQDHLGIGVVEQLQKHTKQPESLLSITAAETLCKFDQTEIGLPVLVQSLQSENPYHLLMGARALELLGDKTIPLLAEARKEWLRLKDQTKDKWKGYDLYATWALNEVFE